MPIRTVFQQRRRRRWRTSGKCGNPGDLVGAPQQSDSTLCPLSLDRPGRRVIPHDFLPVDSPEQCCGLSLSILTRGGSACGSIHFDGSRTAIVTIAAGGLSKNDYRKYRKYRKLVDKPHGDAGMSLRRRVTAMARSGNPS
jgi:hypothetical protein